MTDARGIEAKPVPPNEYRTILMVIACCGALLQLYVGGMMESVTAGLTMLGFASNAGLFIACPLALFLGAFFLPTYPKASRIGLVMGCVVALLALAYGAWAIAVPEPGVYKGSMRLPEAIIICVGMILIWLVTAALRTSFKALRSTR
jgi:hypothetical protein